MQKDFFARHLLLHFPIFLKRFERIGKMLQKKLGDKEKIRTPTCRLAARDDPVVLVPELGRDVDVVGDRVRLLEGLKKFAAAARPEVAVLVATDPVKVPEVPDGWKVKV